MSESKPQKRPAYSTRQAHVRKALGSPEHHDCADCGDSYAECWTYDVEAECPASYLIEDARGVERLQCPHNEHFVPLHKVCLRDRAWR